MLLMKILYLLVIGLLSARVSVSIRVDWNTNKGPIIPPTPRTTQRPQMPYREPAPVWEDQSNDIPNPNPYVYILPPPSRPRPATNNYLTADRRPVTDENYYLYNNQNNYGTLLSPTQIAIDYDWRGHNGGGGNVGSGGGSRNGVSGAGTGPVVAGLSPKYIPNIGFKYFAIVSANNNNNNNNNNKYGNYNGKAAYGCSGGGGGGGGGGIDKLQGKYNAKTKKYKAYDKVKYVPPNYVRYYNYNRYC